MVQPGQYPRHSLSVLSRASPAGGAGEEKNNRRGMRHLVGMHGHSAPRGWPCAAALLPAPPPSCVAAVVRPVLAALSEILPAQSGEPQFRAASAALVCAEPSGRGLRRDLRGVAAAALELAHALCRLARAQEARIRRRADGGDRRCRTAAHAARAGRPALAAHPDACRALSKKAGSLRVRDAEDLRPRSAALVLRRSAASPLAGGFRLHPAAPGGREADGCAVDRRVSADPRCAARRHDGALPGAQPARRRLGAQAGHGVHGAVGRQDRARAVRAAPAQVGRAMKQLRVLVLLHPDLMPPETSEGYSEQEINVWKTEYDVVSTLRAAGHEVRPLGVHDELKPIREEIEKFKPDVVFSLLEQFQGEVIYDQNVASYLELSRIPYTGCNPRGLMLARGKDLSKTLVHYHRIPVPSFAVFPMRRKVRRPARLSLPLIVKSLSEDASYGISQASVVDSDEKLAERVAFIHERIGTAAIAEQYVEGREIYVGVLGNERLRVLPVWELKFGNLGQGARPIATGKVKHDPGYQERAGIVDGPAEDLAPEVYTRIQRTAKRAYRALDLDGYARIDFRLSAD